MKKLFFITLLTLNAYADTCEIYKGPGVSKFIENVEIGDTAVSKIYFESFILKAKKVDQLMEIELRDLGSRASANASYSGKYGEIKLTNPKGKSMTVICAKDSP